MLKLTVLLPFVQVAMPGEDSSGAVLSPLQAIGFSPGKDYSVVL